MSTLKLEIQASTKEDKIRIAVNLLQPYYKMNSQFALKVLALLILESSEGVVLISSRRVWMQELGCTRQQLQNALTLLQEKKLIEKVGTNEFKLHATVPLPGLESMVFEFTIVRNDPV